MRGVSIVKSHRLRKTLISSLFFGFYICWVNCSSDLHSDRLALLQFRNSITSDPFGILSSWNSSSFDHCSWYGVTCDAQSRVLSLNISFKDAYSCSSLARFPFAGLRFGKKCLVRQGKLSGTLSPSIGKLSQLTNLSLPFQDFIGEIPEEFWDLENIEILDLEGNSLEGSLPLKFKNSRKLRMLSLGYNNIVGRIPDSFSNFTRLEVLNLSGNRLNGTIPPLVGLFPHLRGLYLSFNQLTGTIPNELGSHCWNLEHIDLSGNSLIGKIPRNLGACSSLRTLLLFSNLLDDIIPPELGSLKRLQVLDVSRNSLSGPIPSELGKCEELSVIVLSDMYDPFSLDKDPKLASLEQSLDASYDDYNYFQGGIPVDITTLPNLRILWAPRATLDGQIPNDWGSCNSLEVINLGENLFSGEIPSVFDQCKRLWYFDLNSNKLVGKLSGKLGVPCMKVFDVSKNTLSGSIPAFSYNDCTESLIATSNEPYDFPSAYSLFFSYRSQGLYLFESSESDLFVYHNFGDNNFIGPLPSLPIGTNYLGKSTVYSLLFYYNNLSGQMSGSLFEKCINLKALVFNFSHNAIFGQIPVDIGLACKILILFDASGNQITGSIPDSFGRLNSIVKLDLSWNKLQGQIPEILGKLKFLRHLSLARNNLTGDIPLGLCQMPHLEVLELSSNSLSGEIPKDLPTLKNLSVLLLDNNRLSGQIPSSFANITRLYAFNISYNNLSGPIPLHDIKCSSIIGNPSLPPCHVNVPSTFDSQNQNGSQEYINSPPGNETNIQHDNGFNPIEIASITSASVIVSVLLALICLFLYTKKCVRRHTVPGYGRREVTLFTDIGYSITFENVVRATGSFNASNCIGSGGFGATYKAEISPGNLLAIKRLSVGRFQGFQQFHAEIKTLGRMRHPNLVTLIGYHLSEIEMFLIYNYLPGGNLEKFIQERSTKPANWRMLHKIALDVARALAYLHDQCVPRVLHRDVKPSNILLDNDYNAYLSDFGLARLLGTSETHATTGVAGTFGYVAPEYAMTCRVSDKADVYSYGVVLLELISDKKALDPSFSVFGNGFNIVAWACMLLRQARAREFFTRGLWDVGPHDDLVEALHLAVMCTVDSLSIRPTMKQVVQRLTQLQPPP